MDSDAIALFTILIFGGCFVYYIIDWNNGQQETFDTLEQWCIDEGYEHAEIYGTSIAYCFRITQNMTEQKLRIPTEVLNVSGYYS